MPIWAFGLALCVVWVTVAALLVGDL